MVQFKDVFTGDEARDYARATSVQKCLRVSGKHNDLEEVGRTARHHTLFEMLGNFSFGDYFKSEAIPFAWELLTKEFSLDPARLWVTIYEEDDEAYDIWRSKIDFPAERIQRLGAKDNFWSMGSTGPCGPCTEIHWDHGPRVSSDTRGPAGEDPRYVEIWNLVFMQYDQAADGTRTLLPRPSIDTGMGLERLAAIKQGVYNNYDTDLFQGIIARAATRAGVRYGVDTETDTALRVLADHARASAFLIADGVMPSNVERGYVLRRIMRRAIRFGVKLGLGGNQTFFHELTDQVIREFADAYPELGQREHFIGEVVRAEEDRFRRTLDRGMRLLEKHLEDVGSGGLIPGDIAFTMSDTYGFPLDLTRLIAAERGVRVDQAGFQSALKHQQALGRAAWKGSGEEAANHVWTALAAEKGETVFEGYDDTTGTGEVIALMARDTQDDTLTSVRELNEGSQGIVVLDRTPFYGESGGQVGDTGELTGQGASFKVHDTQKVSGLHLHHVSLSGNSVSLGDTLKGQVRDGRRDRTRRNHTATHLLHAALRAVLGDHVTQKGSLVAPDRLRFDFSHHKSMTSDEVAQVETMVNKGILSNVAVQTTVESFDEATAAGAMALFGEKYDNDVRVVDLPGLSVELCGGTHVTRSGDIGLFRITSESGVAAGIRRLEAQTGTGALAWVREQERYLAKAAGELKTSPRELVASIQKLKEDRRAAERLAEKLKDQLASAAAADLESSAELVNGVKILVTRFDGDLKGQADQLRDKLGSSIVVLASEKGGKAILLAAATKDIAPARVHAGHVIKAIAPLVGGRGGGRPDMAQAGGKDPSGIDAALAAARQALIDALS
jgi:alanyl-tRNA synthetase